MNSSCLHLRESTFFFGTAAFDSTLEESGLGPVEIGDGGWLVTNFIGFFLGEGQFKGLFL